MATATMLNKKVIMVKVPGGGEDMIMIIMMVIIVNINRAALGFPSRPPSTRMLGPLSGRRPGSAGVMIITTTSVG